MTRLTMFGIGLAGLLAGLGLGALAIVAGDELAAHVVRPAPTSEGAGVPVPAPSGATSASSSTVAARATSTSSTVPAPAPSTVVVPVDPPLNPPELVDGTARVSWYGPESGSHTASGERYDPAGLTFAHKSMAFGTRVEFCGPAGCVVARCSDRGPFVAGRTFDLSRAAFAEVAELGAGVATVTWAVVG